VQNGFCFSQYKHRVSPNTYAPGRGDFVMTGKEINYTSDHNLKVVLEHKETGKIVYKDL
jgi:hypothetical protein